jgi:hypothetical protein
MLGGPRERTYLLCMLGILSSDTKTIHAIFIADGWAFEDFSHQKGIAAHSLNLCSSSMDHATNFVKVDTGRMLKARGNN